ncbi:DUF4132 domain-containing protein [Actinomadura sp. WAC 06369]|uniref:DUF4132 domain-containing protein n=1 Tax=Actinomadura sp. WAC 06369 TaxID=2203193 RepID=UPI0010039002|nr:hypothetical protein DMH08_28780 [Actinomadura sp. WAC 06369]
MWTAAEFRSLIIGRPVLRRIAQRLVRAAGPSTFRLDEDRMFAAVHDAPFVVPPDARITPPHLDDTPPGFLRTRYPGPSGPRVGCVDA